MASAPSTSQKAPPTQEGSILDNPELAEAGLLALLHAKTETLLAHQTGQADSRRMLVNYAHRWLKLVGEEIRDEIYQGLLKTRGPVGMECTVTVLGPVKDTPFSHWLTIKSKEVVNEDDELVSDPIIMHTLVLCQEHDVVYYISGYQPDRRGDKFRAIALDAEALRVGHSVASPRSLPLAKHRCVELASASTRWPDVVAAA